MEATTHVHTRVVECGPDNSVDRSSVRHDYRVVSLSATSQNKIVGAAFRRLFKIDPENKKNIPLRAVISTLLAEEPNITMPYGKLEEFVKQIIAGDLKVKNSDGVLERFYSLTWNCSLICTKPIEIDSPIYDTLNDTAFIDSEPITCFEQLIEESTHTELPAATEMVSAFGVDILVYHQFFDESEYSSFKSSLFQDILFSPEGKINERLTAVTKRLYAVYGNTGTGISYNNFYRDSTNQTPECIQLLFRKLRDFGYFCSHSTCVMFTAYPPLSEDDIELARANNREVFPAMGSHADNDKYLGNARDVVVFTVSGFVDPDELVANCDAPPGWRFVVQERSQTGTRDVDIPLVDNMMLLQPKRMQSYLKHRVVGVYSRFIRWVATIRNVDVNIYESEKRNCEANTTLGYSLSTWTTNKQKLMQWRRALRPSTNAKKRKLSRSGLARNTEPIKPLIDIFFPTGGCWAFAHLLLHNNQLLYCASCKVLLIEQLHECAVGKSCIFGPRKHLKVGELYSKFDLAKAEFTGGLTIDSSFNGLSQIGCTSMLLRKNFPGNNWSNWREGVITVGGAGGTMIDGSFVVNRGADSARNDMVRLNCYHCLPLEIAVEYQEDVFQFIGTWFVRRVNLDAYTEFSVEPFYTFELFNRHKFLREHPLAHSVPTINPLLVQVCELYQRVAGVVDELELSDAGGLAMATIFGEQPLDLVLQYLQLHYEVLLCSLGLFEVPEFDPNAFIAAFNQLSDLDGIP